MPVRNLHQNPFDEGTRDKLELYREYFREWLPVFINGSSSGSAIGEIRGRIGQEIPDYQIRRQLKALAKEGNVKFEGEKRWRRYRLS